MGSSRAGRLRRKDDALYFRDQKLGEVQRVRRQIKLELRPPDDPPEPMRFSALVEKFESDELPLLSAGTRRSYRESFAQFTTYFVKQQHNPLIGAIKGKHVKQFLTLRRRHRRHGTQPLTNGSLAKARAVPHPLVRFAIELELLDANPLSRTRGLKGSE